MQPLSISPEAERGYYVIWNVKEWVRERVSVILRAPYGLVTMLTWLCSENLFCVTLILRPSRTSIRVFIHRDQIEAISGRVPNTTRCAMPPEPTCLM